MGWLETDWKAIFVPEMSLPEMLIRGTLTYLGAVLLLRIVTKREAGKVAMSDLLVVTIIAGVCRNPLVRDTKSIPDGLAIVAMVLFWGFAIDWLSYHVKWFGKLMHPEPRLLVDGGEIQYKNLQRELMDEDQLISKLRQKGVNDPARVAEAWMESDGQISVVKKRLACSSAAEEPEPDKTSRRRPEP